MSFTISTTGITAKPMARAWPKCFRLRLVKEKAAARAGISHTAAVSSRDSAADARSNTFTPFRLKRLLRWERMLKEWKISAMERVTKAMVVPTPLFTKRQAPVSPWQPTR